MNSEGKWLSITVRLSRKSYFPGAVVSALVSVEPVVEKESGEYISYITAQLHGHIGVFGNMATLPKDMVSDKTHRNTVVYGNITKFVNDTTGCLYQTNPIIIESDSVLKSQKAYYVQLTIPKDVFPSIRTSCVRYFHLFSLSFSDGESRPHFISIPINVVSLPSYSGEEEYPLYFSPQPIETKSYSLDITSDYLSRSSIVVTEGIKEPEGETVPLEFTNLYHININQSIQDDAWSRHCFYTSFHDYLNADPKEEPNYDIWSSNAKFGIFGITHNGKMICNMMINTSPTIIGDAIQLQADFQDAEICSEQMSISLYYEEYSPLLKDRLVKSDLVSSINVNCRHVLKYPYSFSIPPIYPATIQTAQVKIGWKLKFSFFFNAKRGTSETAESSYEFVAEDLLAESLTKVNWSYDIIVKSCVNPKFNDKLGERCEITGKEETFLI